MTQSQPRAETLLAPRPRVRSVDEALAPLNQLAQSSPNLLAKPLGRMVLDDEPRALPRYLFVGPKGGDEPLRLAIFAGLHGNEAEGVFGLLRFIKALETAPELARGYFLFLYPICNPGGFESDTFLNRNGRDLNQQFWTESPEPEVQWLQSEICCHAFHGIIVLRSNYAGNGIYGHVGAATLSRHLLEPALAATEAVLPRNTLETVQGIPVQKGVAKAPARGILSGHPGIRPRPFEIVLNTPKSAPQYQQEQAFVLALQAILDNYRQFMAFAQHL